MRPPSEQTLEMLLKSFKLPTFAREYAAVGEKAAREGLTHPAYLLALARLEAHERADRRTLRLLEESRLPKEKSLASFDLTRLSPKARASFNALKDGAFLDRAENVLAFGNPGTGKTHLLCALGQELVRNGRTVLFTLLAERYERRSVLITSNLVFSKWDQIFKDPMTTAAAIDRVVHHAVILELNMESYRAEAARQRSRGPKEPA